jgi:hypothetical protein
MLDNHPDLAVANDTHFIPRVVEGLAARPDLPLTPDIVERIRRFRTGGGKGYHRLGLPEGALEAAAARAHTYPELVADLYTRVGDLCEKPLAGEKTPDYVRFIPPLHALFPETKIVHLIRDGRDVTLAVLDWAVDQRKGRIKGPARTSLWQDSPVAAAALWWEWQVGTGRRDATGLGSVYREVRYEALVTRPEETLRELVDFLELPFDADMVSYRLDPERRAAADRLPPTPGLRDWRTQMPQRDVELVEALVGDLLSDLGYERAFRRISMPIRAEAKAHRKHWARKLNRRGAGAARAVERGDADPGGLGI